MGPQQVLRAAAVVAAIATSAQAAPAARLHERVAIIDLGPADDAAAATHDATRQKLAAAVVAAGLDPVIGDGVEDALAGKAGDPDGVLLAAAIGEARRAFGELACPETIAAATTAITLGAARQAAQLAVPELTRAWAYVLLCNDRNGDTGYAMIAATQLRTLGGSQPSGDVPKDVWDRYPAVDTVVDPQIVDIEIAAEAGAQVWIDGQAAGVAPLHVGLPVGVHIVAAAAGQRRGARIAVVEPRPANLQLAIDLADQQRPWSDVAERVAGWHGAVPSPAELAWVLAHVRARVALVRKGDHLEAWGQPGRAEPPHRIGNDDGVGTIADADRVLALVADRVHTWNEHAPDPDQQLLVEDPKTRDHHADPNPPTKWWVYAAIIGAVAAGAAVVYLHDNQSDTQHVELHFP